MNPEAPKRISFSPAAFLGFLAVCVVLGWGIQTKSETLRVGSILLQATWMVAGSIAVVSRWMSHRDSRK